MPRWWLWIISSHATVLLLQATCITLYPFQVPTVHPLYFRQLSSPGNHCAVPETNIFDKAASYLTGRNRRTENMSSQFLAFPASNPKTRIPSIMCMPTYSWKRPAHRHPGYWFVVDVTESWWHDDHWCLMCTAPIQSIQASASSKLCQPANLSYLSHIANKPVSESRKCHRSIPR